MFNPQHLIHISDTTPLFETSFKALPSQSPNNIVYLAIPYPSTQNKNNSICPMLNCKKQRQNWCYIVIEGQSLQQYRLSKWNSNKYITQEQIWKFMIDICQGLMSVYQKTGQQYVHLKQYAIRVIKGCKCYLPKNKKIYQDNQQFKQFRNICLHNNSHGQDNCKKYKLIYHDHIKNISQLLTYKNWYNYYLAPQQLINLQKILAANKSNNKQAINFINNKNKNSTIYILGLIILNLMVPNDQSRNIYSNKYYQIDQNIINSKIQYASRYYSKNIIKILKGCLEINPDQRYQIYQMETVISKGLKKINMKKQKILSKMIKNGFVKSLGYQVDIGLNPSIILSGHDKSKITMKKQQNKKPLSEISPKIHKGSRVSPRTQNHHLKKSLTKTSPVPKTKKQQKMTQKQQQQSQFQFRGTFGGQIIHSNKTNIYQQFEDIEDDESTPQQRPMIKSTYIPNKKKYKQDSIQKDKKQIQQIIKIAKDKKLQNTSINSKKQQNQQYQKQQLINISNFQQQYHKFWEQRQSLIKSKQIIITKDNNKNQYDKILNQSRQNSLQLNKSQQHKSINNSQVKLNNKFSKLQHNKKKKIKQPIKIVQKQQQVQVSLLKRQKNSPKQKQLTKVIQMSIDYTRKQFTQTNGITLLSFNQNIQSRDKVYQKKGMKKSYENVYYHQDYHSSRMDEKEEDVRVYQNFKEIEFDRNLTHSISEKIKLFQSEQLSLINKKSHNNSQKYQKYIYRTLYPPNPKRHTKQNHLSLQICLQPLNNLKKIINLGQGVWINGDIYYGQFKNGRRIGLGLEIFPNNQYYYGYFYQDLFHGEGFYFWNQDQYFLGEFVSGMKMQGYLHGKKLEYQGYFKNGKRYGDGICWYQDGSVYQGQWIDGKKHGCGIQWQPSKDYFIGNFYKNKKKGYGTYYTPISRISGSWQQDNINDIAEIYSINGDYFKGKLINLEKNGPGQYYFSSGGSFIGTFQNGQPCYGQFLYSNGQRYVGGVQKMKRHGYGEYHYKDGQIYKGNWFNGSKTTDKNIDKQLKRS